MIRPVTEADGSPFPATGPAVRASPDHHVIHPRFNALFLESFTPAVESVDKVLADHELAMTVAGDALMDIGSAWLYVPHSPEFVKTLAMLLALRSLIDRQRASQWHELGQQRRQGRYLSSAHDVHVDSGQWLDTYLAGRSRVQRHAFDGVVTPLTRAEVAWLLDVNSHQLSRATAGRLMDQPTQEET